MMPATHHRDFLHQLRVFLVFIEFNILICILMERQKRTHLNPAPSSALQPPAQPQPQPALRRRRKRSNLWVMPWIHKRQENGCYINLLADLIHTDIPGCQNFVRMPPAFFNLIEERIHHRIKKSVTNFRKPLEVGLKLAIILRHLATGQTYTSLQYHWLVGRTTICKFIPRSAEPSLLNSRMNICAALVAMRSGKGWRRGSEPDEVSPML